MSVDVSDEMSIAFDVSTWFCPPECFRALAVIVCTPLSMSGTAVLTQNAVLVPLSSVSKSVLVICDIYVYVHIYYQFSPGAFAAEAFRPSVSTYDRPKTARPIFTKFGIDGI
jgi:hypothetical protein